jgi:hypothetical protein
MKTAPAGTVYCVDWGMLDPLRYLNRGKLKLSVGNNGVSQKEMSPADRDAALRMVADPGAVFIAHTREFENFPGTNDRLLKFAAGEGYTRDMLAVISDSFGHTAFEVYRLTAPPAP